jgi:uncharacterized membrane protein YfcA
MVFTAFVGATTHIVLGGTIWLALVITGISALVGANLSSKYANRINHKILNYVIGSLLVAFGVILIIIYLN